MTRPSFHKIHFTFILIVLTLVTRLVAQDLTVSKPEDLGFSSKRLERIDEAFNGYVKDNKMAGSVILVSRKGKIAYYKAFGFRDLEAKSAMTKDAIFRIASQTKA